MNATSNSRCHRHLHSSRQRQNRHRVQHLRLSHSTLRHRHRTLHRRCRCRRHRRRVPQHRRRSGNRRSLKHKRRLAHSARPHIWHRRRPRRHRHPRQRTTPPGIDYKHCCAAVAVDARKLCHGRRVRRVGAVRRTRVRKAAHHSRCAASCWRGRVRQGSGGGGGGGGTCDACGTSQADGGDAQQWHRLLFPLDTGVIQDDGVQNPFRGWTGLLFHGHRLSLYQRLHIHKVGNGSMTEFRDKRSFSHLKVRPRNIVLFRCRDKGEIITLSGNRALRVTCCLKSTLFIVQGILTNVVGGFVVVSTWVIAVVLGWHWV